MKCVVVLPVLLVLACGCFGGSGGGGSTTTFTEEPTSTTTSTTTTTTTTTIPSTGISPRLENLDVPLQGASPASLHSAGSSTTTIPGTGISPRLENLDVPLQGASLRDSTTTSLPQAELSYAVSADKGVRVTGGIPYAYKLDGGRIRLYYCGNGINSAVSEDGLDFVNEKGVRIDRGCDPTIVKTNDNKLRMYYKIQSGPGGPGTAVHKIYSAVSDDGLDFREEGLRIDSEKTGDRGWASVPEAVKLPDGRVRVYYVSDDPEAEGGIMSAVSGDGLNFVKESGARMRGNYVDPSVAVLPDGRYWLLLAHNCVPEKGPCTDENGLYASTSTDGLNYTTPKLVYPAENLFDPAVVELSVNEYRVYYGEYGRPGEPSYIKSIVVSIR